ncbi:hypothetical protein [Microseira sp. BLCC-F43]|uniref:hypothetical protein n=1 Tax=Microseira sp. BLCC-F43 TaxID=3153602 RepID=UPI0035B98525
MNNYQLPIPYCPKNAVFSQVATSVKWAEAYLEKWLGTLLDSLFTAACSRVRYSVFAPFV